MSLRVNPGPLGSVVHVPSSKSYANRYLILAARRGGIALTNLTTADDVTKLVSALEVIGLRIERDETSVRILNSFPACEPNGSEVINIDIGEGGTTARFLLALLSRGKRTYRLRLAGRLAERPWSELIEALEMGGALISRSDSEIQIRGPVSPELLPKRISGQRTTQFASALQLAFHEDGMRFEMTGASSSLPYWAMTQRCLAEIDRTSVLTVPLDWSSAAYPLAFAAVTGQLVELPHLGYDAYQADAFFFQWLRDKRSADQIGGSGRRQCVRAWGLRDRSAVRIDMSQCLDLAPAMAFVCAHLVGESVLTGLAGLVHKESDRLSAIVNLLEQVGVVAHATGDTLFIKGGVGPGPWSLETPADHRLVMTAALFLRAHQGGSLIHPECVEKSFPSYFQVMGL